VEKKQLAAGIPQGSVLISMIFSIVVVKDFINGIPVPTVLLTIL
jgi:hypothetical protein